VKGIRPLVEMFLSGSVPGGRLIVVGDGPLRRFVEDAAAASRTVEYRGRTTRDDVARLMRTSAVCAIPSIWEENCPMVLLDARAARTPVVAVPTGGLPELVTDGVDGLLARIDRWPEFPKALSRLLGDATLRERMARAGADRLLRDHSASSYLRRLLTIYSRVIGSGSDD
jgi:glycosyltransferase involved in cell wall biosynthesis